MTHRIVDSPLGPLALVVAEDGALSGVYFADQAHRPDQASFGDLDEAAADDAARQLDEYFAGRRTSFELDLAPRGTHFQRQVWDALQHVEYGRTVTYGELAVSLGSPKASRAVGLAVGRNPISIIIGCHRVVAANGALTGYAGGVDRKQFLLDLESR